MSNDEKRVLVLVSEMKQALAKAITLADLTRVRSEAEAIRCLVQKAKLGLEMHNEAAEFKLRAERKAGEMLSALAQPGRKSAKRYHDGTFKLGDLQITKNQSSRWQKEAAVPESEFEAYLRGAQESGTEVSSVGLLRLAAKRPVRARMKRRSIDAVCNGESFVVGGSTLYTIGSSANGQPRTYGESLPDLAAEIRNHISTLAGMLLPFLSQEQDSLSPSSRRHSARLFREVLPLLEKLREPARTSGVQSTT